MGETRVIEVDFKKKKKIGETITKFDDKKSETIPSPKKDEEKFKYFTTLIEKPTRVMTVVDATHQDVKIPEVLKTVGRLPLNWSLAYRLPDFKCDEKGVSGTLSFNREPFATFIPWHAIVAIADDNNPTTHEVWPPQSATKDHKKPREKSAPVMGSDLKARIRKTLLGFAKKLVE